MIRRGYSPPFQSAAPKLGADDMGRTVKGLVNVEIQRSNEVSFAVESFGCDGKPVLSMLRDLPCEATGKLVVAGTKNGMPFKLNSDLPRGIGSAIRGSGGAMRTVSSGAAYRVSEWVLYDNAGNYWSLDELTGGAPTYRGETPVEANSNVTTPALCTQNPRVRPYEKRWEYVDVAGDGGVPQIKYFWGGAGWIDENAADPVILFPVSIPYVLPSEYRRIEQWIPDETTPPTGGHKAGAWPDSLRHVECEWYPPRTDLPLDWAAVTDNSTDVIVSKYHDTDSGNWWRKVYLNRWTRPLLEHLSIGGRNDEIGMVICVEKDLVNYPFVDRVALRRRYTGELYGTTNITTPVVDGRVMFTPDKGEGWLMQTGDIVGTDATLRRFRSRATSTDAWGSSLTELDPVVVTLPAEPAHGWTDPVFFRVGKVTRYLGTTPYLTPRLPLWR